MATFTNTWNAAFEAVPADVEALSLGASRIRAHKEAVRERLEIDHSWDGDADDGEHKKVTFTDPLGADPSNAANKGFLYTKDVSAKVELFWQDEDGNVLQLTDGGAFATFPSGTSMVFHQTAAPTGWTKQSIDDKALRVVSGTASSGGTDAFSTVFDTGLTTASHTLTIAQMPDHDHTITGRGTSGNNTGSQPAGTSGPDPGDHDVTNTGGGGGHSHDLTMDLLYEDVIIADKD